MDAKTIGAVVAAKLQSGNREWTTQRCFKLDPATPQKIRDALDEA